MLIQREGTLIQSSNIQASSGSNHQHHKASTHFAGRCVSTSAIVLTGELEQGKRRGNYLKTASKSPDPFESLSLTNGGIHDRRFQFCTLLTDQRHGGGFAARNFRTCAKHAAAMAMVPDLEAILSPPFRARSARTQLIRIEQDAIVRSHRTSNNTRRELVSP